MEAKRATPDSPIRAALYLRMSLDPTGKAEGVDRQREDCLQIAAERGWEVVAEYVDNSISASDARKVRPGYDALEQAWDRNEFDALICYDLDRLSRHPIQLEHWITRSESRRLQLVTANGEADLTTDAGRLFARIKLAVARSEIERKSARQIRAAQQRADKGIAPKNSRAMGYRQDGTLEPTEAPVVREIFNQYLRGESIEAIRRWLNAEGVSTRTGKPWNRNSIRVILTNARYAGLVTYKGETNGKRGDWEPIISEDEHSLILARFKSLSRAPKEGTKASLLGAKLFKCGGCGGRMYSTGSDARYQCRKQCLRRTAAPIDQLISDLIRAYLARPDLSDVIPNVDAGRTAELSAEAKRLRERLETIEADYDAGHIDGRRYRAATEKVLTNLEGVDRQRTALLSGDSAGAGVLSAPDPVEAFDAATIAVKRSVIDTLCEVTLHRGGMGKVFKPETVEVRWHGQEEQS